MTDSNLTPALKRELRNLWYDDPDAKRFGFHVGYLTRETLTAGGYLKEVINESRALLCELDDKGREYIDTLRERIDNRDLDHLDADERLFLIGKLDPKNDDDLTVLKNIIDHDRSKKARIAAIYKAERMLETSDWNRIAHDRDADVRREAIPHADIESFKDETDAQIINEIILRRRGDIPEDMRRAWVYSPNRNTRGAAARLAHKEDISQLIEDDNLYILFDLFEESDYEEYAAKLASDPDTRGTFASFGRALTDRTINQLKDNETTAWNIEYRLREYRRAYREFKAIERKLFADPNGENAMEQRRKAVTEEEE